MPAPGDGFVSSVNARALGEAVVQLGGGRLVGSDKVNPSVGLSALAEIGEPRSRGEPLAIIHASSDAAADAAQAAVLAAYAMSEVQPEEPDLIHERIGP